MNLGIDGHAALITGGASGIGLATARGFAAEGCSVVLWDLSSKVGDVAQEIERDFGVRAVGSVVDIVNQVTIDKALDELAAMETSIDHVVHCAAMGSGKFGFPFTNLQPADWGKTLQVNIQGMVNIAHALTPQFVKRKQGTFVFLASVAGQIGSQTDPPYSASKAANINFAQCMAKDLAPHNVRVNTVCPGMVQTPLNRSVWQAWYDDASDDEKLSYEEWAAVKIKNVVPLGRWQTCEDIAAMIVFLSSMKAAQVTGQTVNVDGGFVMHW